MSDTLTAAETADYDQSRQATLIGCLVFFLLIGNLSLASKILVQFRSRPRLQVEDYFLIIALVRTSVFHMIARNVGHFC